MDVQISSTSINDLSLVASAPPNPPATYNMRTRKKTSEVASEVIRTQLEPLILVSPKKRKVVSSSKKVIKPKWNKTHSEELTTLAKANNIPEYPRYIGGTMAHWKNIHFSAPFDSDTLQDRWVEYDSPKANRSTLSTDEILEGINFFKDPANKGCWKNLSKVLFEKKHDPKGTYRPSGFLKNHRNLFIIESVIPGNDSTLPHLKQTGDHSAQLQQLDNLALPDEDNLSPSLFLQNLESTDIGSIASNITEFDSDDPPNLYEGGLAPGEESEEPDLHSADTNISNFFITNTPLKPCPLPSLPDSHHFHNM